MYEAERKGIPSKIGGILEIYSATDFGRVDNKRRDSREDAQHNNRLDTKRSRSEVKANPITEFHVNEDKNTITYTYSYGETFTELLGDTPKEADGHKQIGKASRELDTEYLSA